MYVQNISVTNHTVINISEHTFRQSVVYKRGYKMSPNLKGSSVTFEASNSFRGVDGVLLASSLEKL